jgi:hypothetical protein
VAGTNKHLFFFFDSLFSCTSQQHGLYILSVGRMNEDNGKEVALRTITWRDKGKSVTVADLKADIQTQV